MTRTWSIRKWRSGPLYAFTSSVASYSCSYDGQSNTISHAKTNRTELAKPAPPAHCSLPLAASAARDALEKEGSLVRGLFFADQRFGASLSEHDNCENSSGQSVSPRRCCTPLSLQ